MSSKLPIYYLPGAKPYILLHKESTTVLYKKNFAIDLPFFVSLAWKYIHWIQNCNAHCALLDIFLRCNALWRSRDHDEKSRSSFMKSLSFSFIHQASPPATMNAKPLLMSISNSNWEEFGWSHNNRLLFYWC